MGVGTISFWGGLSSKKLKVILPWDLSLVENFSSVCMDSLFLFFNFLCPYYDL